MSPLGWIVLPICIVCVSIFTVALIRRLSRPTYLEQYKKMIEEMPPREGDE